MAKNKRQPQRQWSWPLWLALAGREIAANRAFTFGFVLNLSLGLVGFLTIDAFKGSIRQHLDHNSQRLLGGDIAVSARRAFTEEEQNRFAALLPPGSTVRTEIEMMSMVANPSAAGDNSGSRSRLVELRAIDQNFPFYGEPTLRQQGRLAPAGPRDVVQARNAWVQPELLTQLGLQIGSALKIGEATFTVTDVIEHDPTAGSSGLQLAPFIVIGNKFIDDTQLLGKGSRLWQALIARVPPNTDVEELAKTLKSTFNASDLRIRSHRQASEDVNRALTYLNDYLGLTALVALFLAGIGAAYLFHSFLARRSRDIAILLSLGLPLAQIRKIYLAQLALLGGVATFVTAGLTAIILPVIPEVMGTFLPVGMHPQLSYASLGYTLLLATGASVLFCLPLLARLTDLKPATLFQEDGQRPNRDTPLSKKQVIAWLPAIVAYWLMAVVQSRSLVIGSLFLAIFVAALLLFAALIYGIMTVMVRQAGRHNLVLDMAVLNLTRHRAATTTSFIALGLSALLVNVVPQIQGVIAGELTEPHDNERPSLFLFDIQPEQESELESELRQIGAPLAYISPMIRARLTAINGAPLTSRDDAALATREDEEEQRTLNRTYNLSYRASLLSSEELVDGQPFSGSYQGDGPAEMSLEQRFAERLGLTVGDRMTFTVQGVEVEGRVVSLRKVRWTSFQPNFFVQFQPGVLDDAPKSLIAAIAGDDAAKKIAIQSRLVERFPNISIVDVTATIERLLSIVQQMGLAIYLMAALSLIAGLAVLFAIAHHQAQKRVPDMTLLKVLGLSFGKLRLMALAEFGLLGLMAATAGATLSVGAAYLLAYVAFDKLWVFDWRTPATIGVGLALLCTVTGFVAVNRSLKAKPLALLGSARR